jgi:hypothetical protein
MSGEPSPLRSDTANDTGLGVDGKIPLFGSKVGGLNCPSPLFTSIEIVDPVCFVRVERRKQKSSVFDRSRQHQERRLH